ncbi:YigZ family protein [Anaerotalea alkaliphila]|uniref:YigZ family protein n=1 Tax=Anaerotalea alkaliphila TaxID=2662126 RepID=A0A7X5HW47_9FIRM|nr:YigZ family protein [Anaerotalea alkaliphila]NDL67747.1 YigZ family protein [Anaerotalea alkaliphila]
MERAYKTILGPVEAEVEVKKSRFLCLLAPVGTEEEAAAILEETRKRHHGARHNCYAFRLAGGQGLERYSDDGEPAQTAGLPMLDVLRGQGLENVLAVVTRYFGGTLLGTGGLVRAYTDAVKEALESAKVCTREWYAVLRLEVDYSLSGKMEYAFHQEGVHVEATDYSDRVAYTLHVRAARAEGFLSDMVQLTSGQLEAERLKEGYGWETEGKVVLA